MVGGVRVLACGDGTMGQLPTGRQGDKKPRAVQNDNDLLPEGTRVLQVVSGGLHSLILKEDGLVLSCGVNDEGALGRAGEEDKLGLVEGLPTVSAIVSGDSFASALTEQGSVWAWGTFRGRNGKVGLTLGLSERSGRRSHVVSVAQAPVEVYAAPHAMASRKITSMAAGSNHVAMLSASGELYTFGAGTCGQLGRISARLMGTYSEDDKRMSTQMITPTLVAFPKGVRRFRKVFATAYATIVEAELKNGYTALYACGLNNHHQLGLAEAVAVTEVATLTPMAQLNALFPSGKESRWTAFAGEHHLLGLAADGRLFGLGRSEDARLGRSGETEPVKAPRPFALPAGSVPVGVSASGSGGFVWLADGTAQAWGFNHGGELGLGLEDDEDAEPTAVQSKHLEGFRVLHVSAGATHTLFLADTE